jgi:hypothetical protein
MLSGCVIILSGGGGKPCIHPMTFGSDSCAESGADCAVAIVDAPHAMTTPAANAKNLDVDDDIDESSCPWVQGNRI